MPSLLGRPLLHGQATVLEFWGSGVIPNFHDNP